MPSSGMLCKYLLDRLASDIGTAPKSSTRSKAWLRYLIRYRQTVAGADLTRTDLEPQRWSPFMSVDTSVIRAGASRFDFETPTIPLGYSRRDERTARIVYKALAIRRSFGQQAARVFLISMGVTAALVRRVVSSPVERLRR